MQEGSKMKSQVLSNFEWTSLTVFAFLIFLTFFVAMLVWVFRKDSKKFYESMGDLPFDGGAIPENGSKK
jgi:cbb3-type cytochrome oxidase subunit 3